MAPTRRTLFGAFAPSLFAIPSLAASAAAGKVEAMRGDAFAQSAAARRPLRPASDVFVGDEISTGPGSALAMRLGLTTLIRLGAETALRIDRFLLGVGGVLELGRGVMTFDREETAAKNDMSIRSPFGLIAVRGTRFFAGPSNNVFGVFVARGLVTVVGVNTAVEVGPGLGTDIAKPGDEPTQPHPWGQGRIAAAFAAVE